MSLGRRDSVSVWRYYICLSASPSPPIDRLLAAGQGPCCAADRMPGWRSLGTPRAKTGKRERNPCTVFAKRFPVPIRNTTSRAGMKWVIKIVRRGKYVLHGMGDAYCALDSYRDYDARCDPPSACMPRFHTIKTSRRIVTAPSLLRSRSTTIVPS